MIEEGNQIATDLDPVTMPVTELLSEIFCPPNFPKLTAKQNSLVRIHSIDDSNVR